jgi:hypothetical protein
MSANAGAACPYLARFHTASGAASIVVCRSQEDFVELAVSCEPLAKQNNTSLLMKLLILATLDVTFVK